MGVALLLVVILALVFVPPALRAHAARQHAFLLSLGSSTAPEPALAPPTARVLRRRRIAGGLLVAMAATLAAGLLPALRPLLIVHLFLVDAFIAYIALLAYWAERAAPAPGSLPEVAPEVAPARRRRPARPPRVMPDFAPLP